jgi:hypothetical protein
LMKSSQSNFNLRLPSSYLARSYLIATVSKNTFSFPGNFLNKKVGIRKK